VTRIDEELEGLLGAGAKHALPAGGHADAAAVFAGFWQGNVLGGVPRWGALLSELPAADRLGFLAATAVVLSTVANEPKRLLQMIAALRKEIASRADPREGARFALGAGLSGMLRALNRQRWRDVLVLGRRTLLSTPAVAWRSPLLWFLMARAVLSRDATDLRWLRRRVRNP
jgi:hypothetical protein